jgi:hypothetical protein
MVSSLEILNNIGGNPIVRYTVRFCCLDCTGSPSKLLAATSSLSNVSIWGTLDNAKQMERFQPMLDLGKRFLDAGATFERPIMNYATLWHIGNASFGRPG